jgi:two-component system, cell cycle sensor histidine kinase and response regulator CckA
MIRVLAKPVFESGELTRYAALVYRTTWILFLAVTGTAIFAAWFLPASRLRWIELTLSCFVWTLVVLAINLSGRPWHASLAQTFFCWSACTFWVWTDGGIGAGAPASYVVVVLVAGSLLGGTAGVYAGILCVLSGLMFVVAERLETLPPGVVTDAGMTRWFGNVFAISMAAGIQYLSSQSVRDALRRAQSEVEERKRAEEVSRDSQHRFQSIFDSAYQLMGLLSPDGTLLEVNQTALGIIGARREDVIGMPFWETPWWNHSPALQQELRNTIAQVSAGKTAFIEADHPNREGRMLRIEFTLKPIFGGDGKVTLIIPEGRDVTELRRADAVLRESESRFRTLFDLVPYSVGIHDLDDRLLDANAALRKACDRSREEIAGHFLSEFFEFHRTGNREQATNEYHELLQEGLRRPVEITATNRTTGERGTLLLSAAAIKLGRKPCILMVALNITELRRAEQQFRQAQKMEAMGRLAGGIAHDFNNLLTVIGGYTQLALEKLPQGDRLHQSLLEVSRAAEQAEWLTRQLLALSRNKTPEPSVIDLNALIRDTEKMLRRLIGENIELRVSLRDGLAAVRADPGQMVQVLVNLAVNARDAMPERGSLTIRTETVEVGEELSRAWKLKPSTHVRLSISDTGTGMDEETQSHMFEPFFTTKPEGQGTGLGLSMVYGVVKQSGGSVTVSSEPGVGTVFEILLPEADPGELTHQHQRAPELSGGKGTVLLVEDDEALRAFARNVLERAGYLVLQAADGAEALTLSDSRNDPIDLLVTDLTMPGAGGLEVARRLRLERPGLAVLYMSGHLSGRAREGARADRSGEFLQKPFSPAELLNGARRALDVRRSKGQ